MVLSPGRVDGNIAAPLISPSASASLAWSSEGYTVTWKIVGLSGADLKFLRASTVFVKRGVSMVYGSACTTPIWILVMVPPIAFPKMTRYMMGMKRVKMMTYGVLMNFFISRRNIAT